MDRSVDRNVLLVAAGENSNDLVVLIHERAAGVAVEGLDIGGDQIGGVLVFADGNAPDTRVGDNTGVAVAGRHNRDRVAVLELGGITDAGDRAETGGGVELNFQHIEFLALGQVRSEGNDFAHGLIRGKSSDLSADLPLAMATMERGVGGALVDDSECAAGAMVSVNLQTL